MSTEEILAKLTPEISEVHITGGMPPDWPWERYLDIVRSIHRASSGCGRQGVHGGGDRFLPQEIQDADRGGAPAAEGRRPAHDAGRRGGGLLRAGPQAALQLRRSAPRRGSMSTRPLIASASRRTARCSTGISRRWKSGCIHMIKLREAQDETGGFLTFIPLAFQPGDDRDQAARTGSPRRSTT